MPHLDATDASANGQLHLQVCANPGDELFYYNPDLGYALDAGAALATVYLTAGSPTDDIGRAGRRRGAQAAYAVMLGQDADATWQESTRVLGGGVSAIVARPERDSERVSLIFLDLAAAEDEPVADAVFNLWCKRTPALVDGAGGSVGRTKLIETLTALLREFAPTLLRVPDVDPDCTRYHADGDSGFADDRNRITTAWFAVEAARLYVAADQSRPLLLDSYRGLDQDNDPTNLGPEALGRKLDVLAVYGGADGRKERDGVAPGDRAVGANNYPRGYATNTSRRYMPTTHWLTTDAKGRAVAALVRDGRPVLLRERESGSERWEPVTVPPEEAKDGQFTPRIELLRTAEGRLLAFGVYAAFGPRDEDHMRTVQLAQQLPNGEFEPWADLGTPYESANTHPVRRRGVGVPSALALTDGGAAFFERNFGTGVSGRAQTLGRGWSQWLDIGGSTRNGYAVALDRDGRIELFASGAKTLVHWRQTTGFAESVELVLVPKVRIPASAGPVALALESPTGVLRLYARQPHTGWVLEYRQDPADLSWLPQPRLLGDPGGYGPLAATALPGNSMLLATRGPSGRITLGVVGESGPARWCEDGPLLHGAPALYTDQDGGRTLVAAVDTSGRLWVGKVAVDAGEAAVQWRQIAG